MICPNCYAELVLNRMGWNNGVAMSPAGTRHREYRKLLSTSLSPSAARRMSSSQEYSAHRLLKMLLNGSGQLREHVRTTIGGNVVDMVFGEQISTPDFDYIALADDAHHKFALAATPYRYAVDYVPICEYLNADVSITFTRD